MTRRQFFMTLTGVTATQVNVTAEGFSVSGLLTDAGQSEPRYFAIGQSIALMLDPAKVPAMTAGADALLGSKVRLTLTRD